MEALLAWLLPAELSGWAVLGLIISACFTSGITASLGIGGGILLLAIMSTLLPAAAIIPLHGLVQLGSNANRAALTLSHVHWQTLYWFAPGVLLGALLASLMLVELPPAMLQLSVASFILLLCWGPAIPARALGAVGTFIAGVVSTFISHFVGATGPLVSALIKQQQQGRRQATVATIAAAMTLQHAPKALVYSAAGFIFSDWIGLAVLMIVSGAIGTRVGLGLLNKTSDQRFTLIFNGLLTVLALRLIWQAVSSFV